MLRSNLSRSNLLRSETLPWLCCLVLLTALPAAAKTDASVDPWFQKALKHYEQGPYSVSYTMSLDAEQQGMAVSVEATGDMLYGSKETMRMDMNMSMSIPQAMPAPMEMSTLIIRDGDEIWTEVDNPLAGGKQIVKMSVAEAAKQAKAAGMMGGVDPSQMDPASQLQMFRDMADLRVIDVADGRVKIGGPLTQEAIASFGPAGSQLAGGELTLILAEKTGELLEMAMGSQEAPLLEARFTDLRFLEATEIPAGSFDYTPPEGAMVNDMTAGSDEDEASEAGEGPETH